jgi:hypothetical protein
MKITNDKYNYKLIIYKLMKITNDKYNYKYNNKLIIIN